MEGLHRYVPLTTVNGEYIDDGEVNQVSLDKYHCILFGGDQVTAARARGSQGIRRNSKTPLGRIEGLAPVIEDWHAKGVFVMVLTLLIN